MRNKAGMAAAALLAGLLAGGPALAQTTITMWTFVDPTKAGGREVALKAMIESFEKANPTVRVKVEPQVWTTLGEKFVLAHNAGNAPDISWINAENLGLILNTDAAADLGRLVTSKWSEERRKDLVLPGSLEAVTVKGKVMAMPLMASTWSLLYRKDLLKQAGLTPDDLKTWEGFTAAARKMTRDTNGDGTPDVWGVGLGLAQERFSMTPAVLATIGGQNGLLDKDCKPSIATAAAERALKMQADWIAKDKVTPREALSMTSDDAIDQFAAGRYAMEVFANSRFEQIQRTAVGWNKDDLGIAPIPGWTADKPGPAMVSGWFAVAWAKSKNLTAAAQFVDHMSGPEGMALWNLPGGQVPMLHSVARRPEMKEDKNGHLAAVADQFAKAGTQMPAICNWSRTLADFNLATQQVVLGQRTAMDALRIAEKATADRQ